MTKEQALQILQEAIDKGIYHDEDVEIFDAIKIAIKCLQSDPNAPDWSQAPEWANYYHIGWWYEYEPKKTAYKGFLPTTGRVKLAKAAHPIEKLFKRPEKE